jgi:hypothetical protein
LPQAKGLEGCSSLRCNLASPRSSSSTVERSFHELGGAGFLARAELRAQPPPRSGSSPLCDCVVRLCFGGGQNALGVAGALMGVGVLRGLELVEHRLRQERPAELRIRWRADGFDSHSALATIGASTLKVSSFAIRRNVAERIEELRCSVRRRVLPDKRSPPLEVLELARRPGVLEWEWRD